MERGEITMARRLRSLAVLLLVVGPLFAPWPQSSSDEDLRHDPSLPRAEQIRRHQERLKRLLAEHRAKQAQLDQNRQEESNAELHKQRDELKARISAAVQNTTRGAPGTGVPAPTKTPPVPASRLAAKPGAPGAPGATGAAAVAVRTSRAIAFLSPFRSLATVGEEFETDIRLLNSPGLPYDELSFHLKYDPLVVAPVEVNDSPIHPRIEGTPALEVNASRGLLKYFAKLRAPSAETSTTLLKVRWLARNPIVYSEIDLVAGKGKTRVGKGKRNILGFVAGGVREGGTLPAGLMVIPKNDSPRTLMPPLGDVALTGIDERVHLRLESERETARAGEEWVVSLMLRNDATLPFNNLSVRLLFDPAQLQVVDWHTGNWIRQGDNIYDGFAHETYPFEVHRANRADNKTGQIVYHVGTREMRFFPSGELARIKFRVLSDASVSDVRFDFEDPQRAGDEILTDVKMAGASVFYERKLPEKDRNWRPAPDALRRPGT